MAPAFEAIAQRVEALRQEARAAGALPDPMLSLGLSGPRAPWAEIGKDPMAMARLELAQTVPWPGTLGRRRAAAEAEAVQADHELAAARRRVAGLVRGAYAALHALDREDEAWRESSRLIDLLLPSVRARYETSQAAQLDLIRLQLEQTRVEERRDDLGRMRAETEAGLNAWLARAAGTSIVTAGRLPEIGPEAAEGGTSPASAPAGDRIEAAADSFPEVDVARAALEASRRRTELAQREAWPGLTLGAEYGHRGSLDPAVGARVAVELPVWGRQRATTGAARHAEAMAGAELYKARLEAGAEAAALAAKARTAAAQIERLREETVPQARLATEAARAAYVAGRGGIDDVIEGMRLLAEARAMLAQREADRYAAVSVWRALVGREPLLNASAAVPGESGEE